MKYLRNFISYVALLILCTLVVFYFSNSTVLVWQMEAMSGGSMFAKLRFAALGLGVMLLTLFAWQLLYGIRKGRAPLVVYWGSILLAAGACVELFLWHEYLYDQKAIDEALLQLTMKGIALMAGVGFLILLFINLRIWRLCQYIGSLSMEGRHRRLRDLGGDEFEGITNSLNSLAELLERREQQREENLLAVQRFVPQQVLALLGKESLQQVDQDTIAYHHMATMMVQFSFPPQMYSRDNSKLLFDGVNQVIQRAASVATAKGGTVFNFAYNSFEVVMEKDLPQVFSCAVAIRQEALALNEERAAQGLPMVTVRIALTVGDVVIGMVGDGNQLVPATISTSFSTVRQLIQLAENLDAGILCTESEIRGASGYGSRYLGKCRVEQAELRIYELFDGDAYEMRKGKQDGLDKFSQAVFCLYGGEISQAKRGFLELVHDCPGDGAARYYLYLADRMETNPGQACIIQ